MPRIVREAASRWEGNVARGFGTITAASSGAFAACRTAVATRDRRPEGKTSPEELLAAAHGACFTMSLASELTKAGTPPERLDVRCVVTMDEVEGKGHQIVHSAIEAHGTVPDCDEAGIRAGGRGGRRELPVLGADPRERDRRRLCNVVVGTHWRRPTRRRGGDEMATERTMSTTWRGTLMDGSGTIHEAGSGAFGATRRHVGLARRGARRQDEPRGAHRRRALGLLRDGALARPRTGRNAGGAARHLGDGDLRSRYRDHEDRARRCGASCRDSTGRLRGGGRGRQRRLPRLEGTRCGARDHARRGAGLRLRRDFASGAWRPRRQAAPSARARARIRART